MGDITKNFSRSEFACPCECGLDNISMTLVNRLQAIRDIIGQPIRINSGVRCVKHNAEIGGVMESEHVPLDGRDGEGVDIKCEASTERHILLGHCHEKFSRVGIGKTFIHVGVRATKPQEVTWLYE